jgi:hypothetical protein
MVEFLLERRRENDATLDGMLSEIGPSNIWISKG